MLQLALGVVDAVPADRRADMAEERLLYLASEHRFARVAHKDVLWEAAAEVLLNVERLYYEGRLDRSFCELPPHSPAEDPVALLEKLASPIALDIGRNNYRSLASTCIETFVTWARAHPLLDSDDSTTTRLRWERGADRHSLGERQAQTARSAADMAPGRTSPPIKLTPYPETPDITKSVRSASTEPLPSANWDGL
jgi:hypothetical protein